MNNAVSHRRPRHLVDILYTRPPRISSCAQNDEKTNQEQSITDEPPHPTTPSKSAGKVKKKPLHQSQDQVIRTLPMASSANLSKAAGEKSRSVGLQPTHLSVTVTSTDTCSDPGVSLAPGAPIW